MMRFSPAPAQRPFGRTRGQAGDKKALDSNHFKRLQGSSAFFTISQLLKPSKLKILVMQALHEKRVASKTCTATNSLSNIAILNRTSKPNPRLRRSPVAPASGTVGSVMVSPDTKHESPQILERATIVGFLYDFSNLASGIAKLIMRSIRLIISHLWRSMVAWIWRWHGT